MTNDRNSETMGRAAATGSGSRVTLHDLVEMKRTGKKLVMITAYDALFASLVDQAGVDLILVGDSLVTVLGGETTTLSATLQQMIYHGKMVTRGTSRALVVVDMPFMSYQVSSRDAVRNAGRVMKRSGAAAVKIEGGGEIADTTRAIVSAGIPVMGHLGFTPQSVHALGGHRIQGRERSVADRLIEDAKSLESAGAFAIVLELVPAPVAKRVSEAVEIPTIGIGAGPHCDGQVLVLHDMLGLNERFTPKFLKRYAELGAVVREAVQQFGDDVRKGTYPDRAHSHDS